MTAKLQRALLKLAARLETRSGDPIVRLGQEIISQASRAMKRGNASSPIVVGGRDLRFANLEDLTFLAGEILVEGIYRFRSHSQFPVILDCGANIGLSVIFFKMLHPRSRVIAFEPDPRLFSILQANSGAFSLENVEPRNAAVADQEGSMPFHVQGSLGGRLANAGERDTIQVPVIRLRSLLSEPVDMLKLDIEGAETEVLEDCADALENVSNLFVEYHSFVNKPQTLDRILAILRGAGFRVHLHVFDPSPQPLFRRKLRHGIDTLDMNVDVFAWRE